jgi:hypothetical protein
MEGLMPMFGPASGTANGGDGSWNDDNLDVDLLAEYLLEDGNNTAAGITFDFK